MICQVCNERPATLHFTKIINGEKTEEHLCDICAQEKGETLMFNGGAGFSINNLLAGLLNSSSASFQQANQTKNELPKKEELRCENCHMSFQQFVEIGKFGCAQCYTTFKDQLNPILRRLHSGNVTHTGKIPKKAGGNMSLKKRIDELKYILKDHINKEEFEKAAEVRDEIRSLENKLNTNQEEGDME